MPSVFEVLKNFVLQVSEQYGGVIDRQSEYHITVTFDFDTEHNFRKAMNLQLHKNELSLYYELRHKSTLNMNVFLGLFSALIEKYGLPDKVYTNPSQQHVYEWIML